MLIVLTIVALIGLIGLIGLYGYSNTFKAVVREVEITVDKDGGFDELRIVQLSDLHMERLSIGPERLANLVQEANADLIVMTGDYLDNYENRDKFLNYLDALKAVEPEHGIWLVWGNHDHYLGEQLEELAEKVRAKGVRVLANEWDAIPFGSKRLNIIGIDDFCLGKSDIARSFDGLQDGVNLVLSHDPNIVLQLEDRHEVDYLLSGHLHGNQVKLPIMFKICPMGELPKVNVIAGMHQVNGKTLYISEGMGQAGLNIRLGTRPEITIHTLRSKPAA